MKALFRGGPWDGLELDFPVLPQWITFGTMVWDGTDRNADPEETTVLASPADFLYVLCNDGDSLYYALRVVEAD